jgi:uncharacterized protein (TIGR00730 family)
MNREENFLKGPSSRWKDFLGVLHIASEFIRGFRKFHFLGPCVTVFGSARYEADHPHYKEAREIGRLFAQRGFTIMTGGGPGIMEAANRGAKDVNGRSVGCNIILPKEQEPNPYLDELIGMDHFYVRKVLLVKYSYAFVVMPGGFGTMDELFETLTLIQTKKIEGFPVVLVGKHYWSNLLEQVEYFKQNGTISAGDDRLFALTDSPEEALQYVLSSLRAKYQRDELKVIIKRKWWLFEEFPSLAHRHHLQSVDLRS